MKDDVEVDKRVFGIETDIREDKVRELEPPEGTVAAVSMRITVAIFIL